VVDKTAVDGDMVGDVGDEATADEGAAMGGKGVGIGEIVEVEVEGANGWDLGSLDRMISCFFFSVAKTWKNGSSLSDSEPSTCPVLTTCTM
jgi:hypothetical protein